jgi:taurine--2-oxoglutarate transaminase
MVQNYSAQEKTDSLVLKETNFAGYSVGKNWKPLIIDKAEGVYFQDDQGKRYMDFSSQPACVNLGHNNKNVITAMREQADNLVYIGSFLGTPKRVELSTKLQKILPQNLKKYYFANSGSEANEAAVKMVRIFLKREGRFKIISRYNSYHGWTAASTQLTGNPRRFPAEPSGSFPGVVHVPDPYCYRCPFGLKYPECGVACADYVEYVIENEGNVGAMILEPVTGASGVVVPPKEYLPKIRKITSEHGVFLIADEVMSGWGRTGEWFAINNWGVQPDILTTAKGITGGHFPLSLTATNSAIGDFFEQNWLAVSGTYSAHPLGMAAASAAIDEYQRLNLISRSKELGSYLGKRLEELKEKHPSVGDVRGIGLFWAVELVKNRETKEPFDSADDYLSGKTLMVQKIANKMLEKGVFIYTGVVSHLVVSPPLIITTEEIDLAIEALDEALILSDQECEKVGASS